MTNTELFRAICNQSPMSIPVFSQCWWLDAVCSDWDVAVSIKGDQVTGIWPYVREERLSISFNRNPRLTPYLGPHVFYPPDIKETNRDSHEHDVIEGLLYQLPNNDVWKLSVEPGLKQAGLFRNYGLKIEVQQTFLIDLSDDIESIFQKFKEPLRRNIRAAEKELMVSYEPACIDDLYEFGKQTLFRKRVRQNYSLEEVKVLLDACIANDAGAIWVARNKETNAIEAIVWNVWDNSRSYYFMGGKNPLSDGYRATSLLLWHCIREAKLRGALYFDLEGSMDQGVERFFRNFGGKRELYLILRKNGHWLWRLIRLLRK